MSAGSAGAVEAAVGGASARATGLAVEEMPQTRAMMTTGSKQDDSLQGIGHSLG